MTSRRKASLWARLRNSWRRKRYGAIDPAEGGFIYKAGKTSVRVAWDEINQIDVGTQPTLVVEIFYVVLHRDNADPFAVDEMTEGFQLVEDGIFARWPMVRDEWNKVVCGPPHVAQYVTLWKRD
jgi:hypothetical protein